MFKSKTTKYSDLPVVSRPIPFILETLGGLHKVAADQVKGLAGRVAEFSNVSVKHASMELQTLLSITLQKFNGYMLADAFRAFAALPDILVG
jgi:hypothetical protein